MIESESTSMTLRSIEQMLLHTYLPPAASILQRNPVGGANGTGTSSHTYVMVCLVVTPLRHYYKYLTGSVRSLYFLQANMVEGSSDDILKQALDNVDETVRLSYHVLCVRNFNNTIRLAGCLVV